MTQNGCGMEPVSAVGVFKGRACRGRRVVGDVSLPVLFCAEWAGGGDRDRRGRRPIALSATGPAGREVQAVPGHSSPGMVWVWRT